MHPAVEQVGQHAAIRLHPVTIVLAQHAEVADLPHLARMSHVECVECGGQLQEASHAVKVIAQWRVLALRPDVVDGPPAGHNGPNEAIDAERACSYAVAPLRLAAFDLVRTHGGHALHLAVLCCIHGAHSEPIAIVREAWQRRELRHRVNQPVAQRDIALGGLQSNPSSTDGPN